MFLIFCFKKTKPTSVILFFENHLDRFKNLTIQLFVFLYIYFLKEN